MDKLINKCRRLLALVNTDVVRELMQQDQLGSTPHLDSGGQGSGEDNAHAPVFKIEWL